MFILKGDDALQDWLQEVDQIQYPSLKDPTYSKYAIPVLGKALKKEFKILSSNQSEDSTTLESFSWDSVIAEANDHAPLLYSIL